jgi:hypothetical protein
VIQNSASINSEFLKEAMQGVVAALAAAAHKGGSEETTPVGLGTGVVGGTQVADRVQGYNRHILCRWI